MGFHIFAIIDGGAVNIFILRAFCFSLIISLEKVPRSGFTRSEVFKFFMALASCAIILFRRLVLVSSAEKVVFFFCGTWASYCCGLSRCGAQARDTQAQRPWLTGPATRRHVGSSRTGARTRVPCIIRRTLNHCATREALDFYILPTPGLKTRIVTTRSRQLSRSTCWDNNSYIISSECILHS